MFSLLLLTGDKGFDDPYITFRYAGNLLAGHGFVYNVGQRMLSTTAPLYALLLAGLGLLWPDLPALSNVLSVLSLIAAAGFLLRLAHDHGQTASGIVAALFLSLSPLILSTFGAETCLYVMLILAGLWAYDRSRLNLAALAWAVAAMVRPDGLIAAPLLAAYHLARRQSIPWRPVILYVVLTGAWFLGLWLYFGSPVPVTLVAKQQQGQMAISSHFLPGFVTTIRALMGMPFYWLHLALALAGIARVVTKTRYWLPLLLWTAAYFLAYTLLGVSRYFWYYAPLVPAFAVLTAEGLIALWRLLDRIRLPRPVLTGGMGLVLIALLTPLAIGTLHIGWRTDPRFEIYQEIGQWLQTHTPAEATVGALEVGIIGYHADRTMIDFAGLIQPDVAQQLGSMTTFHDSTVWAAQTYQPDYIVLDRVAFSDVATSDWFQAAYRSIRDFGTAQGIWHTVYMLRPKP